MPDAPAVAGPRLLLFGVRGRRYACALASVREIVPFGRLTRLPGAPAAVAGVCNVRGIVLTVVDLGLRLVGEAVDRTEGAVLLLEYGGKVLGVGVDELQDVLVPEDGIQPAPDAAAAGTDAVVRGVVATADGVAVVLDPAALVRETLVVAGGEL